MDWSAVIFGLLAVGWAAYLVPRALTRQTESLELELLSASKSSVSAQTASDVAIEALREQLTLGHDADRPLSKAEVEGVVERVVTEQVEALKASADDTAATLAKYSAHGLAQARVSFLVAVVSAVVGFLVIVGGVVVTITRGEPEAAWVPIVAGAVVDAFAGLMLSLTTRSQARMVQFYDKLRLQKRLEDALQIAADLEDLELGSRLRVLLALQFAELSDVTGAFRSVVDGVAPVDIHPSSAVDMPYRTRETPVSEAVVDALVRTRAGAGRPDGPSGSRRKSGPNSS